MTHLQQIRMLKDAIDDYVKDIRLVEAEESEFDILRLIEFIENHAGGKWHTEALQKQHIDFWNTFKENKTLIKN